MQCGPFVGDHSAGAAKLDDFFRRDVAYGANEPEVWAEVLHDLVTLFRG